jgi:hypothetical protein
LLKSRKSTAIADSDPASRTPGFGNPLSRDGFDASAFRSAAIELS